MASWWELTFTGEPTAADFERVEDMVAQGFTGGQLADDDTDAPVTGAADTGRVVPQDDVARIAGALTETAEANRRAGRNWNLAGERHDAERAIWQSEANKCDDLAERIRHGQIVLTELGGGATATP